MNLDRFEFLGISRNFSASIGSFQGLPAEVSEVILLSQRLALKYNTTPRGACQHFLTSFFQILCGGGWGQNSNRKEPSQASLRDARFPLLSPAVTFSPGRGKSVLSGGALLALTGRCVKAPPFGGAGAQRLRGFVRSASPSKSLAYRRRVRYYILYTL